MFYKKRIDAIEDKIASLDVRLSVLDINVDIFSEVLSTNINTFKEINEFLEKTKKLIGNSLKEQNIDQLNKSNELTNIEKEVLEFIGIAIRGNIALTQTDLAYSFFKGDRGKTRKVMINLQNKGYITFVKGKARSIKLTNKTF